MTEALPEIQGKIPDSKEEVWIAAVLYEEDVPFVFQFAIAGGLYTRMGRVVDFLLYPYKPNQVPLEFYGLYWHENELPGGEVMRLLQIEEYFGVKPLVMWGEDAEDIDEVRHWIRKNVLM